jgi:hypothetical protein
VTDIPAVPPLSWFQDPGLDQLTPLTVTAEGRVYGHLCGWGTKHRGLNGNVVPPRSRINYGEFMLGHADVMDGDQQRSISVGNLTMGIGHAPMSYNLRQATEHYDNADAIVAQAAVGEDQFGAWVAGAMLPDVDPFRRRRFRSCGGLSGDWRHHESGGLELCAALAVPVPGFPVPRARVASGAPLALVAAGFVPPASIAASFAKRVDPAWTTPAATVQEMKVGNVTFGTLDVGNVATGTASAGRVVGLQRAVTPADLAEQIADSLHRRQQDDALASEHGALLAELDDTPDEFAALMAQVDDSGDRAAALLAELGEGDAGPKGLS